MPIPLNSGSGPAALTGVKMKVGRTRPLVGVIGDSWTRFDTAELEGGQTIDLVMARQLGVDVVTSAQGGTGWARISESSPATSYFPYEDPRRIDYVLKAEPDLLVWVGSLNSNAVSDGQAITDAVVSGLTYAREKAPRLPLIVIGMQPSSEYRSRGAASVRNVAATRAGVEQFGGLAAGVAWRDWAGVADGVVRWQSRPEGVIAAGTVLNYDGSNYRVLKDWQPVGEETPQSATAPTKLISMVMTGPDDGGTRMAWLQSDGSHPTRAGALATGVALASLVRECAAELRRFDGVKPEEPQPQPQPEEPQPQPQPQPEEPQPQPAKAVWYGDLTTAAWRNNYGPILESTLTMIRDAGAAGTIIPVRLTRDNRGALSHANVVNGVALNTLDTSTADHTQLDALAEAGLVGLDSTINNIVGPDQKLLVYSFSTESDTSATYVRHDRVIIQLAIDAVGRERTEYVSPITNAASRAVIRQEFPDIPIHVLATTATTPEQIAAIDPATADTVLIPVTSSVEHFAAVPEGVKAIVGRVSNQTQVATARSFVPDNDDMMVIGPEGVPAE